LKRALPYCIFFFFAAAFCLLFWHFRWFGFEYGNAISRICTSVIFALIIGAQAMTKSDSVLNLKNFAFATRWGKYTYGIYLIHPMALALVGMGIKLLKWRENYFWTDFSMGIVAFLLTLWLSKLSYLYLEGPFLKMKQRLKITTKDE